jgi:hypothetical protein
MSESFNIEYNKKVLPKKVQTIGFALLIIGLILVVAGYLTDSTRSAFNNIIIFMFLASIGVGSLFFVGVEYLSGAVWSTPFRRIGEIFAGVLLVLPLVVLPLLINMGDLFHWMHPEVVEADKILKAKAPYLNVEFFIIRVIAFLLIWILFYFIITKNSRKQDDTKDQSLTKKNIKLSAVFMPFFAITITFTAIDWLMSLDPHWFSTI